MFPPRRCTRVTRFPRTSLRAFTQDRGNLTVEFALVAPLLLLVAIGVLQLMLTLHVRTVLTSAAMEGARVAALVGSDLAAGEGRSEEILESNIAGSAVKSITARPTTVGDASAIAVDIEAELPLIGVFGVTTMTMTGHAFVE